MASVHHAAHFSAEASTLEVKVNDLHRKLDQLLGRNTGCPMCGTCSQHTRYREAISSQLSSQARLLDSLEMKVLDMQASLEILTRDLEGKQFPDRVSIPLTALQRRKSLPVRTSMDEVYIQLNKARDLNMAQHTAPCKGALVELNEGEAKEGNEPETKTVNSQVKGQGAAKVHGQAETKLATGKQSASQTLSSNLIPKLNTGEDKSVQPSKPNALVVPSTALTQVVTSSPCGAKTKLTAEGQTVAPPVPPKPSTTTLSLIPMTSVPPSKTMRPDGPVSQVLQGPATSSLNGSKAKAPAKEETPPCVPSHKPPKVTGLVAPVSTAIQGSASPSPHIAGSTPNIITKEAVTGNVTPPSNPTPPKMAGLTVPVTTAATTSAAAASTGLPSKTLVKADATLSPPSHKPPKITGPGIPVSQTATTQSLAPPPTSSITPASTTNEGAKISPPGHNPTKTMGLPAPQITAEPSLRHVSSCPDSLQRLNVTGPKPAVPPLMKSGTVAAVAAAALPANHLKAGGVQIKISAAVDQSPTLPKTKTPPKTCVKVIDDVPPQPAPFAHRFVSLKSSPCDSFSIHTREVLGGGRFGKVHKCTEVKTSLRLAAKIINTRNVKEREMALNEIQVMNQLSHANILQLYEAFEVKNQVVLILEYVEGGELFERIVDESCTLTEVDAMVFVRQICEGIQYMHQMYVLHLDLKPENILCVNRSGHQVKIIDFGLARRYKPREKLRVSFGTPEFLAPEVVNFDFVSFPTDMWTLGVVTYMLLSGLSPFLGDDDSQTLNNVLMVNWYFDEDAFEHISAEAKDFISNLLIRERSGRLSAAQCLKHPWLNNITQKAKQSNIVLKSQILLKKYMARRMWKKNYIAIAAANRFKKIGSSGSLTSLGI